jgi:predicted SAM-dependent methyltransferase
VGVTMTDRPWLTAIIPTIGRDLTGLARAVDSLRSQGEAANGVEILVVGDTHSGELPQVPALAEQWGVRYVGHDGGRHCYGQPQRQAGTAHATGGYLCWGADDDIWTHNALADIRACIDRQEHPRPLVFRFVPPWRGIPVPVEPVLRERNVDASCLVVPNIPEKLGRWGLRYEGDYDFAQETAAQWGGDLEFCNHVVCWARPEPRDDWMAAQRRAAEDAAAGRLRLNLGCGQWPFRGGWVNVDADPAAPADAHYTFPPLPYQDGTVDDIYLGHVLEHFRYDAGQVLLKECLRVLKPGGRLGVVVPDTRAILAHYLAGSGQTVEMPPDRHWRMADLDDVCATFLFSTVQDSPHLWAYDQDTLRRALERAGFAVTGAIPAEGDPRVGVDAWYQVGWDAVRPEVAG